MCTRITVIKFLWISPITDDINYSWILSHELGQWHHKQFLCWQFFSWKLWKEPTFCHHQHVWALPWSTIAHCLFLFLKQCCQTMLPSHQHFSFLQSCSSTPGKFHSHIAGSQNELLLEVFEQILANASLVLMRLTFSPHNTNPWCCPFELHPHKTRWLLNSFCMAFYAYQTWCWLQCEIIFFANEISYWC